MEYQPQLPRSSLSPRRSGPTDDASLMDRIAQGDRSAFQCIYQRYAGRVLAALRRFCGDQEDVVQDMLQEVFLTVWRKAASYQRSRGDLGGWLYAVTRNQAFGDARRRKPTVEILDADLASDRSAGRDLRISLRQAMAALRPDERRAVTLAYFGGLTYDETATQLGVPLGTLKSRIRSGLRKMATMLEDLDPS